jgi:ferredoxin
MDSLLDLAEDMGPTPEFSCRAGICGTCKTHILAGDVAYFEDPLDDPGTNQVLLCCARPNTSILPDL